METGQVHYTETCSATQVLLNDKFSYMSAQLSDPQDFHCDLSSSSVGQNPATTCTYSE